MGNKKTAIILGLFSLLFATSIFIGCSGGDENKAAAADSSAVQQAPADTSMIDTNKLDTASTRPIKNPN
jgi:hypothetical protein